MKDSKQSIATKIRPSSPSGYLKIAGKKVSVSLATVIRSEGSSPKVVLQSLKEVSKKAPFKYSALMANE